MTTDKKVARRKLSLLELAADIGNVSKACRVMGYSRQQFYEIRRNFQTYGAEGLIDRLPGARGPHPNEPRRVSRRQVGLSPTPPRRRSPVRRRTSLRPRPAECCRSAPAGGGG